MAFLGEHSDVAEVMGTPGVFCQPNLEAEPFALVFVKAMAAGSPIVTTLAGGPAEFLGKDSSILVPLDPGPLAEALHHLIASRELRDSMGAAAGQSYAFRFDPLRAPEASAATLGRSTPQPAQDQPWA